MVVYYLSIWVSVVFFKVEPDSENANADEESKDDSLSLDQHAPAIRSMVEESKEREAI